MNRIKLIACGVIIALVDTSIGYAQGGGFSGPVTTKQDQTSPPLELVGTNSQTASMAMASLDTMIELGEIKSELRDLGDVLTEKFQELPVFVDLRAAEIAEIKPETIIEDSLPNMPLRSALRKLLQPHMLGITVENEGLVVTPDFAAVTRQGIATDEWVDNGAAEQRIHKALAKDFSVECVDTPLEDVVELISKSLDIPVMLDIRALEEIGLTTDTPLTLQLKNTSVRSILRLMLRPVDLTYMIKDEVLQVTTVEAAEQNLVSRIYFLEATGIPIGDFKSITDTIRAAVVPDTWDILGGPSSIMPISSGEAGRPAILVSATTDVHHQIETLMASLRRAHVGPDARTRAPRGEIPAGKNPGAGPAKAGGLF